jgi:glyoxylase I family protein
MTENICAIHHGSVIVDDTEKALSFYRDILGLRQNMQRPSLGYPGAWLDVGDQQIHLLELANPDPREGRPEHGGRDRHIALSVKSLDGIIARLEENAYAYTASSSGRRALFCRDPDGNAIEFVETG